MSDFQIIVSVYQEDIDWLKPVANRVMMYLKDANRALPTDFYQIFRLPNVGREGHSYLHYIVENYDNLPEICVFIQGRIHDHIEPSRMIDFRWLHDAVESAKTIGFASITSMSLSGQSLIPWCDEYLKRIANGNLTRAPSPSIVVYVKKHANIDIKIPYMTSGNGLFAVRRDHVLRHDRSVYESMRESLSHSNDPEEGHFLERLWVSIFQ